MLNLAHKKGKIMAYTYTPSDISSRQRMNLSTWSLQICHALEGIIAIFGNTFLVSYIMHVNVDEPISKAIVSIALYYIAVYGVMLLVLPLIDYIVDRTDRVWFYRIGMLLKGSFIVLVIFLGKGLSKYSALAGVLYGLSETFYYAAFNTIKNEVVPKNHISKFVVMQNIFSKLVKTLFPVLLGILIDVTAYKNVAFYVLGVFAVQLTFSFFIKSKRPANSKFEFFGYIKKLAKNDPSLERVKRFYPMALAYGGTTIQTALASLLTIYTFKTNLNLGLFTGLFAFLSVILLLLFKRIKTLKGRGICYIILSVLSVGASVLISFAIKKWTYILFNLILTTSCCILGFALDIQRNTIVKKTGNYDYITEHQAVTECCFNIIRVLSYSLMLVLGMTLNLVGLKILISVVSIAYPLLAWLLYKMEKVEENYPMEKAEAIKETENENK